MDSGEGLGDSSCFICGHKSLKIFRALVGDSPPLRDHHRRHCEDGGLCLSVVGGRHCFEKADLVCGFGHSAYRGGWFSIYSAETWCQLTFPLWSQVTKDFSRTCGRLATYRGGWFSIYSDKVFVNIENPFESPPEVQQCTSSGHIIKTAPKGVFLLCGPEETRTPYLVNANDALYQMSYGPVCVVILPDFISACNRPKIIFDKS